MTHSIKRQFAGIFIGLMFGTVLLCFIINSFYLEKYYKSEKIEALHKAYDSLKEAGAKGNLETEDFGRELNNICIKYNLSLLVMDMNSQITICVGEEREFMQAALYQSIFSKNKYNEEIETFENDDKSEYYIMQNVPDERTDLNYLQMWGMFDADHFFMLRCSVESIKESASIANRFLAFTGLLAAILGGIIIYFISGRITNPIRELTEISERMTNLDFDVKYHGKSKNEIAVLGDNINKLSGTLEKTISELKKDIEQKEKIDEMRREFLSNVTHELKTPIALIQGYAEGLKENVNDDEESRNTYCDVIIDESAKMNNMVKKLLNLNELENGDNVVSNVEFDFSELVRNYLSKAEIIIEQSGASVINNCPEGMKVSADEFLTEEVLQNYFTNAINHVKYDKKIEIKCVKKDNGDVRVSVVNSGDPIPEDSLPHIWEKFYKVDKARTREYGGSGVGLSIVKAVMEAMGKDYGVINYENAVEFYFDLTGID
ncbi:MAG: HAMP domain-containing protein [Lachnospiraceae bacterium]|nr:HAMP domain-containing protein [Lachnospiraceae bacterium]